MKLELRKVSWSKALSEETPAYSAQVWIDGRHFCDVSNHGTGGCDSQHPPKGTTGAAFYPALQAMEARIKAEFPPETVDVSGGAGRTFTMEQSLESLCQKELYRLDLAKSVKRDLAKKIMFVKPGKKGIWTVKIPNEEQRAQLIGIVKTTHKIEKTLNEMTLDEAVAVYEQQAA
jgi:hypothetical protein